MNDEINYKSNPLHGVSLKNLLIELVDHYGFEILFAYLNINCFKTNPSIESSVKFLKKTDWAREKVESFYLYQFKNLPRATKEQFQLPPRSRVIPEGLSPGEPAELSLEDAEILREKRTTKASAYDSGRRKNSGAQRYGGRQNKRDKEDFHSDDSQSSNSSSEPDDSNFDPWANFKK